MTSPLVTIVILNTNRRDDTLAALASITASDYSNILTLVLDNGSTDGSVEAIEESYPATRLISLDENLGYAGNNNVGIDAALELGSEWIMVLNEDTILEPACLSFLVEAGENDPEIGIVGPLVYHFDEPDVIQSAGGRIGAEWEARHIAQNEPDDQSRINPSQVDWISGCAILARRAVLEAIGGFDTRFFYYWEETDFCLRAAEAGWKIFNVPQAKLWHKGVQRDYKPGPSITYYNTRNRFLVMSKHKAPLSARIQVWGQTFRTLLSWSIKPEWKDKHEHRDAMWQGMRDFITHRWGMRAT